VTFDNIVGEGSAIAQVQKITEPAGFEAGWEFNLELCPDIDPQDCLEEEYVAVSTLTSTGTGFATFLDGGTGTNLLLDEGSYRVIETEKTGWQIPPASAGCEFSIDYPDDFGATKQCTYTNKMLGKIIIEKQTIPDEDTTTSFGFTQDIDVSGPFSLKDGDQEIFLAVSAGQYTVTEVDPTPEYDLTDLVCTDDFDGNSRNVVDSSEDKVNREATINLDPGETVKCVFTNTQRGMVDLLKLTDGVENQTMRWDFTLQGPGVNVADWTPPTLVDFDRSNPKPWLIPDEVYTLCETGIPPTWTLMWALDVDTSRTFDVPPDEVLPFVGCEDQLMDDGLYQVYDPDPDCGQNGAVNATRCVNFTVDPGETVSFIIDNQRPGGEPRTPGYWKNWNTCTGGNQVETAAQNGGPSEGWFLLDDLIPTTVGSLPISSCEDGVSILDRRDLNSGKKRASDAAYNLASHLLAAKLNLAAGAETCQEVVDAVAAGDTLLSSIGFDGTGKFLRPKDAEYWDALDLADTLDDYNNGDLCE
jgi:hypothetical protein